MKFKSIILAALAAVLSCALSCPVAFGQASILPPGETCFSALAPTSGGPNNTGTGFIGLLGTITGGTGYTNGFYGGVPLTGGSGTNATANVTVSGGIVTQVAILNPGVTYVVGDVLGAISANIGGTGSGFSVGIASVSLNYALAGGSVGFYIPNTLSIKQTWQDAGQTILNQNPVPLDANGCAVIYGAGIYRQILKDSLGNTVWDKLTAATNGANGIFWASLAGGTGNAITVTDTSFASQDGYNLQFLAKAANSGPSTIAISGGSPIAIVNDLSTGPAALSGGEIGPGNTPMLTYDAANVEFHIVNPAATTSSSGGSSSLTPPQGYLNLVGQATGDVIQTADVIGTSTIFYSPFVGNTIPIWNGSVFKSVTFSELTATLTSSGSPVNTIQDECVFSNNGVSTLVTGPSWTTVTAGSGNRGTGAASAQLSRLQGIWVNAVQIIGYNGLSSFTIPANQCTYVGSIYVDNAAGQVTAHRNYGQNRKFGVWNMYNRQPIYLKAGDSTSSWTYGSSSLRAANNAPSSFSSTVCNVGSGTACNGLTIFSGQPEETYDLIAKGNSQIPGAGVAGGNNYNAANAVGYNSITTASGFQSSTLQNPASSTVNLSWFLHSSYFATPSLGINVIIELEADLNTGTMTFTGAEKNNLLTAAWRG